jgi:hypothetical protein
MIQNTIPFLSHMLLFAIACRSAEAGPICVAVPSPTLAEELRGSDAAVVVRLVDRSKPSPTAGEARPPADSSDDPILCTFEVVEALKGDEHLARRPGAKQPYRFQILHFGEQPLGARFFAFGIDTPTELEWGTPFVLGDAALDYVRRLPKLPAARSERMLFFLNYLEHADPLLADDAFDELLKAEYSEIAKVKDYLPRENLLRWIDEPSVVTNRRRLYFRMLSLCAGAEDIAMLESRIACRDEPMRKALDAIIFSYLVLKGPAGLPLVENQFLKNAAAEFHDTYSAVMALRSIGSDTTAVSHRRLAESLRHVLARPEIADLVIGDLARLQDWTALPRLVELFKTADPKNSWVRVPVILYLRACPLPEAGPLLESLSKLDPDAARRAKFFFPQQPDSPDSA